MNESDAIKLIQKAVDAGITFLIQRKLTARVATK